MNTYGNYYDEVPCSNLNNGEDLHFCIQFEHECLADAFKLMKEASIGRDWNLLRKSAEEYAYHKKKVDIWKAIANEVDRTR